MPITINKKSIHQISGPTCISILVPNQETSEIASSSLSVKLPVFILFGDEHFSYKNMCTNCDSKDSCYTISSSELLKQFDRKATETLPIDIYVEGDFLTKSFLQQLSKNKLQITNEKKTSGPLSEMLKHHLTCYNRYIRINDPAKYKMECPTKQLRWHFADIRQLTTDFPTKYMIETWLSSCQDFVKLIFESVREKQHKNDFLSLIHEFKNIVFTNWLQSDVERFNFLFGLLKAQIDPSKVDTFLSLYTEQTWFKSLLMKQVRKLSKSSKYKLSFWKATFEQYYKGQIVQLAIKDLKNSLLLFSPEKVESSLVEYANILDCLKECMLEQTECSTLYTRIQSFQEQFHPYIGQSIDGYLLALNSWFLDMYFIARCFKKPKGSNNAILNIGYFGQAHTENLLTYLTKVFHYDVVYHSAPVYPNVKDTDTTSAYERKRCIEIPSYVDINMDQIVKTVSKLP